MLVNFRLIYVLLRIMGLTGLFYGCTKPISLELQKSDPRLVVEAQLLNIANPLEVRLRWSNDFFSTNPPAGVKDAEVTITETNPSGEVVKVHQLLQKDDPRITGRYMTQDTVTPKVGHSYSLRVVLQAPKYGREVYEATEVLPRIAPIDTILYKYYDGSNSFFPEGFRLIFFGQEPKGVGDYYRWRFFSNDSLYNQPQNLLIGDDRFVDGNYIPGWELPIRFPLGAKVRFEMLSISRKAFDYLQAIQTLQLAGGNPFAPQPDNPINNIENRTNPLRRGLGYFFVSGISSKTVQLPAKP